MPKELHFQVEYLFGDRVSFNNKIGKDEGIVTGHKIREKSVVYLVAWSDKKELEHYATELKPLL